ITSITLIIQVIGNFLSIGMLTFEHSDYLPYLSIIRPFVSDGLTLVQPWLLYFFSSPMRKKLQQMFKRSSPATVATVVFKSRSV
ncbi:Protein CBG25072, partial [Caenorhabditis briggsae]